MEKLSRNINAWLDVLPVNPLPALLAWDSQALNFLTRRDLLGEPVGSVETLWQSAEAVQLVRKQQANGSWLYGSKSINSETGTQYDLVETYRILRLLVEIYGFTRDHPSLARAAEYILTYQTDEGDLRGILGNQYMPYYHGAILELLIKAGYIDDARVVKGLDWLLSVRQDDGGWIVPVQDIPSAKRTSGMWLGIAIHSDPTRPHSHMATGMALRALAAHPVYRTRPEVLTAGEALKYRLFKADKYNDRRAPSYWLKYQFPFWWTSQLTALDTLSWLGFDRNDPDIDRGLDWVITNQCPDGLWETGYGAGKSAEANRHWVGLAFCRVLERFFI